MRADEHGSAGRSEPVSIGRPARNPHSDEVIEARYLTTVIAGALDKITGIADSADVAAVGPPSLRPALAAS
jgi:hypothetical protein